MSSRWGLCCPPSLTTGRWSKSLLFHGLLLLALVAPWAQARFYYRNFNDRAYLSFVGSAIRVKACVTCTGGLHTGPKVGAFWYKHRVDISHGFLSTFHFTLVDTAVREPHRAAKVPGLSPSYERDQLARAHALHLPHGFLDANRTLLEAHGIDTGHEGFAFVLQGSGAHAMGRGASGIGYAGLDNGVAVEFDLHYDKQERDPPYNHISIHYGLHSPLSPFESDTSDVLRIPPLKAGVKHTIQISYDGKKVVKVFINNLVKPALQAQVGKLQGRFWAGFTGASGQALNNTILTPHICDWYFDRKLAKERCDHGFVGANCVLDSRPVIRECLVKRTCNQCVGSKRDCRWCTSKRRCTAGITFDAKDAQYCPDKELLMDFEGCLHVQGSLLWVWTVFIFILVLAVFVGFAGKLMLQPAHTAPDNPPHLTAEFASLLFAVAVGALFAVGVSYAVNTILVEISINPVFAVVFGLVFISVGGLIFWQTISHHFSGALGQFTGSLAHCFVLIFFSMEISTSGVVCFLLEKDWTNTLPVTSKIPLYGLLGIALCFSIVFCVVDLINRLPDLTLWASVKPSAPLVDSVLQVRLLSITAVMSGLYFGFVFGLLDVEDVNRSHIELALQQENSYCYPLGCLLGGISTFISHFLADKWPSNSFDVHADDDL